MLSMMPGSRCARGQRQLDTTVNRGTYASVDSGDRNERARGSAATVHDVHLRARDVELGALECARCMQGNLG